VFWRDAFKLVRAILWDQQHDNKWWLTALQFATHIKNHFVTTALDGVPPEAAWTKKDIDMSHFRVPLTKCWAYVEKENRQDTLDKRRIEATFIGYARDSRSYLVHHTQSGTIYSRRSSTTTNMHNEGSGGIKGTTTEITENKKQERGASTTNRPQSSTRSQHGMARRNSKPENATTTWACNSQCHAS